MSGGPFGHIFLAAEKKNNEIGRGKKKLKILQIGHDISQIYQSQTFQSIKFWLTICISSDGKFRVQSFFFPDMNVSIYVMLKFIAELNESTTASISKVNNILTLDIWN